jgi:Zn-dependent peptidase ImmA (M78 family)/DNA-binding XRE family transcriptional regulator
MNDMDILETIDQHQLGNELKQARQKRGFTQADAAEILGVARTTITAIEQGERRVKAGELIKLVRAYGRQVSDFVRTRPVLESFQVQFRSSALRTLEDVQTVQATIGLFEEYCRDYVELEQIMEAPLSQRYPPLYELDGLQVEQAAESVAQEERNRLGLGDGPVPMLRDILEQDVGLRIFYLPLEPSHKFSAMYTYSQVLGGCIAVNRLHPPERRRWSLAHEYAHFLAERFRADVYVADAYQRRPEGERFADAFATYFLMPTSGLMRRYNDIRRKSKISPAVLCTLAHYYGVSVEALTLRLEGMKLLPTGTWERLHNNGFRVRQAQQELGLSPVAEIDDKFPKRYQYLAVDAYRQERISEGQLAHFLRVDRLEARRIANELRQVMDDLSDSDSTSESTNLTAIQTVGD